MIRTTVVGSWPPDEQFDERLHAYFTDRLTPTAAEALLREVAAVAIAQQKTCGLDEYTGGETSADSFILHFPKQLTGIALTENTEAWGGRGEYRNVDEIVTKIRTYCNTSRIIDCSFVHPVVWDDGTLH